MATYEYRCAGHGDFAVRYPIGEAVAVAPCPACGSDAVRVFSAPLLTRTSRPLAAAIERSERSAEAPEVVSAVPGRRRAAPPRVAPGRPRLPRP